MHIIQAENQLIPQPLNVPRAEEVVSLERGLDDNDDSATPLPKKLRKRWWYMRGDTMIDDALCHNKY